MNLLTLTPAEFCEATQACKEGREVALRYGTMAEVWDACPRPDWLLWVAEKVNRIPDDRTLRLFAVWCALHTPIGDGRVTGDLITDPRLLASLEVAEKCANGQATAGELTAADAANAAARPAAADAAAADVAARPAAADAVAYAAYAAAAAYRAVAYADASDWIAANAAYAVAHPFPNPHAEPDAAARAAQADQFRRMVPNPFRSKETQP